MNAPAHLIDRLVRATVGLKVTVPESHPSASILGTERSGTGTVIDSSGLVLTVNYVVLGANTVEVTLVDGETLAGSVIAQEFASGLAVVRIDSGTRLPSIPLHSSADASVGQEVVIMASVGGSARRGNNGAITSLDPFDAYWEYRLERAILTTAVNPGYGGAPLFDLFGRMIGVVSLDLGEIGRFTQAIPVELFLSERDELLQFGRCISRPPRAWVGFYCYPLREHIVIAGVLPGAPGDVAGLKSGDVVLAVDGESPTLRGDLYALLWAHRAGETLTFSVLRDGEIKKVPVASGSVEAFFA